MKMNALDRLQAKMDACDTILGFCQHGKAVGMIIDMPGMKRDVTNFVLSKQYKRIERVGAEEGRRRFASGCPECHYLIPPPAPIPLPIEQLMVAEDFGEQESGE